MTGERKSPALLSAAMMLCLAACSIEDTVDDTAAPDAFEIPPDPPISTPGAHVSEGMRTLLLEPVQRGGRTLAPVRVKAGREIHVTATCLGRGTFTVDRLSACHSELSFRAKTRKAARSNLSRGPSGFLESRTAMTLFRRLISMKFPP